MEIVVSPTLPRVCGGAEMWLLGLKFRVRCGRW